MDIAALSMGMSSMQTSNAISMSLMKMAKDNFEDQGMALVQMLDTSVVQPVPHSGSTIDIKI